MCAMAARTASQRMQPSLPEPLIARVRSSVPPNLASIVAARGLPQSAARDQPVRPWGAGPEQARATAYRTGRKVRDQRVSEKKSAIRPAAPRSVPEEGKDQ